MVCSGFQVPMQNPVPVSLGNGAGDWCQQCCGFARRQRSVDESVRQSRPLNVFYAEIRLTIVIANFVNRNNVGMVQTGGRFRLGTKSRQVGGRCQFTAKNHFQRDNSPQAHLPRFEHDTHAPPANFLDQHVIADPLWKAGTFFRVVSFRSRSCRHGDRCPNPSSSEKLPKSSAIIAVAHSSRSSPARSECFAATASRSGIRPSRDWSINSSNSRASSSSRGVSVLGL